MNSINNLPTEVIYKIFTYIPDKCDKSPFQSSFTSLSQAILVCKRWLNIGQDPKLWIDVKIVLSSLEKLRLFFNGRVPGRFSRSTSLVLSKNVRINEPEIEILKEILLGCDNRIRNFSFYPQYISGREDYSFKFCETVADIVHGLKYVEAKSDPRHDWIFYPTRFSIFLDLLFQILCKSSSETTLITLDLTGFESYLSKYLFFELSKSKEYVEQVICNLDAYDRVYEESRSSYTEFGSFHFGIFETFLAITFGKRNLCDI